MNMLLKGPKTVVLGSKHVKVLYFYVQWFTVKSQQEEKELEITLDKVLSGNVVKDLHSEI